MPKLTENYFPNDSDIVLPVSVENRFQKAIRAVGLGPNRIGETVMTKRVPPPDPFDFSPKKRAKVIPTQAPQVLASRD